MILDSIHVYPVKSLAGVDVAEADVERCGLRGDRRWLVLNPDGSVLTAREEHLMLGVSARPLDGGAIELSGSGTLRVEPPVDGELIPTALSRLESVRAAGPAADEWLSRELGTPVRLGWLDDPSRRSVSAEHGGRAGDVLSLADAGPLLLTTAASLRRLNVWLEKDAGERGDPAGAPMVMKRFRPNVVVEGDAEPFAEDAWKELQIGEVRFRFAEHCDRCVLTTIDPETLVAGKEPLRTLGKHRQWDHKTFFGIRIVPVSEGAIRVGDRVSPD